MNEAKLPLLTTSNGIEKFIFLASHGLRTPLTAIRWSGNQLRKQKAGQLNTEQNVLANEIHFRATELSRALNSMFLLTKIDEGEYGNNSEEFSASEIIKEKFKDVFQPGARNVAYTIIENGDCTVCTNSEIFQAIVANIGGACIDAIIDNAPCIEVEILQNNTGFTMKVSCTLQLVYLQSEAILQTEPGNNRVIGGTAGLLLAMSTELVKSINGTVEITESEDKTHTITFHLPA